MAEAAQAGSRGTAAEERRMARLLRAALAGPLTCQPGAVTDAGLVTLCDAGGQSIAVAEVLIGELLRRGLLRRDPAGTVSASPSARAFLRRRLAEGKEQDFRQQHGAVTVMVVKDGDEPGLASSAATRPGRRSLTAPVRVDLAESPLAALARLKDRQGAAFLPAIAIDAGERLAADFTRAGLQPRITQSWEPRLFTRAPGQENGIAGLADGALAARRRVALAADALGPELAGVALDVCCFCKGLETVERERQWPARSAKLMLRTALLALARHYNPPARGGARHWGAEGFRPDLG